jgi:hypothetical protein
VETFSPKRGLGNEPRLAHIESFLSRLELPDGTGETTVTAPTRIPDDVPILNETTGAVEDPMTGSTATATPDLTTVDHVFAVSTPAQITGDVNNYALASPALYHRLSTDASHNITGFAAPSGARQVILINVGAQDIVLKHLNAGSTAANQIICPTGDITLGPDESAVLFYDTVTLKFRVLWRSP